MAVAARAVATRVARPGRVVPPKPTETIKIAPLDLPLMAAWFGILTGLLELAWFITSGWITGKITYETLRANWHYVWMIPVSNLAIFGTVGLTLGLLARSRPRLAVFRIAVCGFSFLAALSLTSSIPGLYPIARWVLSIGLACQVGLRISAGPGLALVRRLVRRTLPGLAVVVLVLVAWKWSAVSRMERRALTAVPPAPSGVPNVLLIVLDTVRADALTPYGSARDTTPNLARLARRGVRFDGARSTAPWTLPSHASLFTGRWKHELSVNTGRPLDDAYPTLAEFMADHGYATAGFVANTHNCNAWYGLNRGFARYEDFYENTTVTPVEILRSSQLGRLVLLSKVGQRVIKAVLTTPRYVYRKNAAMINRDALAWLNGRKDRPFFVFLNYYDPHDPYVPPRGASRRFSQAGSEAGTRRSPLEAARDDYDDCLAYLDDQIGRLFEELKRREILDNTLVIITADHGEAFGEHGLSGHGVSLYRPELHVPLLVIGPSRVPAGRTVDGPVSLRDVPATVADLVGLGKDAPFPGGSLARLWESPVPGETAPDRPVLSDVDRADHLPPELSHVPAGRGLMQSVASGSRVYIRNGDGREELYDVQSDPEEQRDLSRSPAEQGNLIRLRAMLGQLTGSEAQRR